MASNWGSECECECRDEFQMDIRLTCRLEQYYSSSHFNSNKITKQVLSNLDRERICFPLFDSCSQMIASSESQLILVEENHYMFPMAILYEIVSQLQNINYI